jgi:hypothetical protein
MLKYLLPLILFAPLPSFAQYIPQGECLRESRTWVAGYTDRYGIWRPGYYRVMPVPTAARLRSWIYSCDCSWTCTLLSVS